MKCPLPKWFRHKFVPECKTMQIAQGNDVLKQAAFVFTEVHFRYAAPFECFTYVTPEVERNGKKIGKYKISVEQVIEESKNGE